ncbi:MAG: serpin family protein [Granulosicoccus sp.]
MFDDSVFVERFGTVQSRDENPVATDSDMEQLTGAYNQFSLDVHNSLASTSPQDNAIVSGYSLASTLTLTMSGTAGESRASLLHLDGLSAESVDATANAVDLLLDARNNDDLKLRSANRLFVTDDSRFAFRESFLNNAVGNYGAPIISADFRNQGPAVVEQINAWVTTETNGLIQELLTQVDPDTLTVILNAILLDAIWESTFEDSGDRQFTTHSAETVVVPFFGSQASHYAFVDDTLMPDDLVAFEQSLTPGKIAETVQLLTLQSASLDIPEWSFEQSINVKELLLPLGLPSGPMDFSNMLVDSFVPIEITGIAQKARIEVDKDGTRAAAATTVTAIVTSVPAEPLNVTIDRPFWYAIRDRETGLLLFSGRVLNPLLD